MKRSFSLVAGVLSIFLLAGCGGGGGGGNSASPYTGLTSQASLTQDNVVDITTEAYQAGYLTVSATTVTPLGETGPGRSPAGDSLAVALVRVLRDVADQVDMPRGAPSRPLSDALAPPLVVETVSDTIFDGLGGSISYTLTLDTDTGNFSGTFTFSNWHGDADSMISGSTSVSGHYDQIAGAIDRIRFIFHAVAMLVGPDSVTLTGTVDLSLTPPTGTSSIEMYLKNDATGKTVWINGYLVVMTDGPDESPIDGIPDYTDVNVSGKIYLHDYGYVVVSTPTPFRIYDGSVSGNPSGGVLQIDGSEGRSARLVVIDESTGYYVEADLNADGTYEWTSITYPWP